MYSLQGEQNPRAHIATSASNGIFHETTMDTCALFGFYGMAVCLYKWKNTKVTQNTIKHYSNTLALLKQHQVLWYVLCQHEGYTNRRESNTLLGMTKRDSAETKVRRKPSRQSFRSKQTWKLLSAFFFYCLFFHLSLALALDTSTTQGMCVARKINRISCLGWTWVVVFAFLIRNSCKKSKLQTLITKRSFSITTPTINEYTFFCRLVLLSKVERH